MRFAKFLCGASQEEYLLSAVMALAITSLLSTLKPTNAQDYVLACFFLISTTSFLKIRWFMGTGMQVRCLISVTRA